MKNNIQPTHDLTTTTQAVAIDKSLPLIKFGLDVDLWQIIAIVQYDHQHPKPAQSFSVAWLVQWVREKVQAGHVVHRSWCGGPYSVHSHGNPPCWTKSF